MTPAEQHVTKCRLCGQPQTGRQGLCNDCSRALTRAREGSAALRTAPTDAPRKARAIERIVLTSSVESEAVRTPARGRLLLWAAIAVVAIALVLTAAAGLSPHRTFEPKIAERATRIVPPLIEPGSEDDAADAATFTAPVPRNAAAGAESPSLPKETTRVPAMRPARSSAIASSGARSSKSDSDASRANGSSFPAPDTEPPVQQAVASAPATSSGNDAQALASALEKCSGEKFLAGVICEQKARLRYCEGKWGQDPQCTKKPRVD